MVELRKGKLGIGKIDEFFDVLVKGFSSKENPPTRQYFSDHYYCDPFRPNDCSDILVVTASTAERPSSLSKESLLLNSSDGYDDDDDGLPFIVSTVRVFNRSFSTGAILGVGEVATLEAYRGLGLSTRLLTDASLLAGETPLLLHANETYRPYYSRLGYKPTAPVEFVTVPLLTPACSGHLVSSEALVGLEGNVEHPDDGLGGIIRTPKYYEEWYRADARRWGNCEGSGYGSTTKCKMILRLQLDHISAISAGDNVTLQVRDCYLESSGTLNDILSVAHAIIAREVPRYDPATTNASVSIKLPTIFLEKHNLIVNSSATTLDDGWMYKGEAASNFDQEFFIWPCDSW